MRENIFVDRHEQSDVIEDWKNFPYKIEELKPYIVKFDENGAIKPKIYSEDCTIGGNNWRLVIVITHNKCTFSVNNRIQNV